MRCQRCNSYVRNGDLFCPKCGWKITRPAEIKRSKPMKQMMKVIVASLVIFAVGMFATIVVPLVGLVIVIVGGIGLVISSCTYLFLEYKHTHKYEVPMDYQVSHLPQEPISLSPRSGFIYPDILRELPKAYEQILYSGFGDFFVSVLYRGAMVMQIINVPDRTKGELENIGIFFFPYLYEDQALMERFANNDFIHYFDHNIYSDEGTAAYFGKNLKLAMQVASYILAAVYYIPTNEHLTIQIDAI